MTAREAGPGSGWRKSRHSMADGNCVEAGPVAGGVAVRDTADRAGVRLEFTAAAWAKFTAVVKR